MDVLRKTLLSAVSIGLIAVAGALIFLALPINWQVGSVWISWSAMIQNGVLAICVLTASFVALRAIWKPVKKEKTSNGS